MSSRMRHGFTLVEVLLAIALLGVLALVAVPAGAGYMQRARLDAAARQVLSDLRLAQSIAYTRNSAQEVTFAVGSNSYTLPGEPSGVVEQRRLEGVTITATTFAGHTVRCLPDGSVGGLAAGAAGATITLHNAGGQRVIEISPATGRARVRK